MWPAFSVSVIWKKAMWITVLSWTRADGSLVVTFRVGRYEAIRDILKSWIPNILILKPDTFKKELMDDVKRWVKRQEKTGS
jgi:predicted DNA-binding transcriptional regulator YafY